MGEELGSPERLGDKISLVSCKTCLEVAKMREEEVRVQQQAQEALRQGQEAGERAQEAEQSAQAAEERLQVTRQRTEEVQRQLERFRQEACEREMQLQQQLQRAQQQVQLAGQKVQELEGQLHELERQLQGIEPPQPHCIIEPRVVEGEPQWVLEREEIEMEEEEELGRGGWAVVKVAKFRGIRVAAKCLHGAVISNYNRRLFIREINFASRIRHPNLLLFIGATLDGELIILTELMPTSVRTVIEERAARQERLSPVEITTMSLDVAQALNYLHLMRPDPIIHRDISSANVLLEPALGDSWRAKVSDFGSVNFIRQVTTVAPGNPAYAALEANDPAQQTAKMDIFSLGVLLLEMATCQFPDPDNRERHIALVQRPRLVVLIRQCISADKDRRPTASELLFQLR